MQTLQNNWVTQEDQKTLPWRKHFTPTNLIDNNASGSSSLGQYADLLNTNTAAQGSVSNQQAAIVIPLSLKHTEISSGWEYVTFIFTDIDEITRIEPIRTTAEKVENIRDIFGVSVSQLAKILKTSRPSIYSWLEGEEPREQSVKRIQQIYGFASNWSKINPYHFSPEPLLRQPLGTTPSLLECLKRDELNPGEINSKLADVLELMHRRRERMDRSKQYTKNSQRSDIDKDKNRHELTRTVGSSD